MSDKETIEEAVEFLKISMEGETTSRSEMIEDLRFRYGEQWSTQDQMTRKLQSRPMLTINELDTSIRQVCNQIRQQRPRIKCHGVNDQSDEQIAEIITGLTRHIEQKSDADYAYDNASDFAVTAGKGFIRVNTNYVDEKTFDQEVLIAAIENPFSVYFDPFSVLSDGSDAEATIVTDMVPKADYKRLYPGASKRGFSIRGSGDTGDWLSTEEIRVAEYFKVEHKKETLFLLSNGMNIFKSQMPDQLPEGLMVIKERPSSKRVVKWKKLTQFEVLEERELGGKYIPIVPVYGIRYFKDGKIRHMGMVRMGKDPQRMVNFWQTAMTELVALAPKTKWVMAEGQDEGYENEWAQANVKATAVLHYKQKDVDGQPAPPPERLQPEAPPAGAIELALTASQNLKRVLGVFDPAVETGGPRSGKAIRAEQSQGEITNFHFYDNLTRSIKHVGRIILDYIPIYYDTERVLRIIGADGRPKFTSINQMQQDTGKILNDVTVGEYDVVMETGPGYDSKRQEAVESMTALLNVDPDLMKVAGDLIFRNMDFPGAEVIADRMAAANPLAQIEENTDIPPQAQMMIKQLQQKLQQSQQEMQQMGLELKFKHGIEQMKQTGETQRTHMELITKAHDVDTREKTSVHDTNTRAQTAITVEDLKAHTALLLARIDERMADKAATSTAESATE